MQGCSDDGFKEFRSWLVSKGRTVYEAVLAEPDRLAEITSLPVSPEPELGDWPMLAELDLIQLELLGAFESPDSVDTARLSGIQTGWEHGPPETLCVAWEESDVALSARYPRLWKLYRPGGKRSRG